MGSTLSFFVQNWDEVIRLAQQHVYIVAVAVIIAIFSGVPTGIWITFHPTAARAVLYLAGINTASMTDLNFQVDVEHKPVKDVARDWLKQAGLL
jgi:hypothetical protein